MSRSADDPYLEEIRSGQLAMFMTAPDIMATHQPLPGDAEHLGFHPTREAKKVWNAKLEGSKYAGGGHEQSLHEHLTAGGQVPPVHLAPVVAETTKPGARLPESAARNVPTVVGGHHRIAALADVDPNRALNVHHWPGVMAAKDVEAVENTVKHFGGDVEHTATRIGESYIGAQRRRYMTAVDRYRTGERYD